MKEVFRMRMKNEYVIRNFVYCLASDSTNHSKSLYIAGNKLFNYDTCIAEHHDGELIVNVTKYSVTTTKLVNMVKREAEAYRGYKAIDGIRIGAHRLMTA
jgi:hypothetical protein